MGQGVVSLLGRNIGLAGCGMRDAGCGMQDESKNQDRIRDERTFNGWMRDKSISAGARFAPFDRRDEG